MPLVILLAVSLFGCAAFAEGESAATPIDLYVLSLTVGGRTYNLPLSASELTAMGLRSLTRAA